MKRLGATLLSHGVLPGAAYSYHLKPGRRIKFRFNLGHEIILYPLPQIASLAINYLRPLGSVGSLELVLTMLCFVMMDMVSGILINFVLRSFSRALTFSM